MLCVGEGLTVGELLVVVSLLYGVAVVFVAVAVALGCNAVSKSIHGKLSSFRLWPM